MQKCLDERVQNRQKQHRPTITGWSKTMFWCFCEPVFTVALESCSRLEGVKPVWSPAVVAHVSEVLRCCLRCLASCHSYKEGLFELMKPFCHLKSVWIFFSDLPLDNALSVAV